MRLCEFLSYNPSQIDEKRTILEQMECIKELLKTYPNQQWFVTKTYIDSQTASSVYAVSNIETLGRQVNVGDLLLTQNTTDNIIYIYQVIGTNTDDTVTVKYVGKMAIKGEKGDKGDTGDKGDKGDTAEVTVEQLHNLIEGSATVVADINEEGTAINLHLDNDYTTKIDNSLQLPTTAPSTTTLVGVGTNKAQTQIKTTDNVVNNSGILRNKQYTVVFAIGIDTGTFDDVGYLFVPTNLMTAKTTYKTWDELVQATYSGHTVGDYIVLPVAPLYQTTLNGIKGYVTYIEYDTITGGYSVGLLTSTGLQWVHNEVVSFTVSGTTVLN